LGKGEAGNERSNQKQPPKNELITVMPDSFQLFGFHGIFLKSS
jgi:hypothetical protein